MYQLVQLVWGFLLLNYICNYKNAFTIRKNINDFYVILYNYE